MSFCKRLVLASLVLGVLATALPPAALAEDGDLYEKARVLARTLVWKDINSGAAGSATVAIMDQGRIVYAEGFGMADRERSIPVDPQTMFNIGSISKVFAATAIMLLVEDGKVQLDEPVTTYLPDFTMADLRYREITIRMLLNHSSGLPGTTGANNFGFRYNPDFFQQTLDNLARAHLKHRPGAQAPYTNDGFTLAEMVVERVSGQKFLDFLSQRVFQPLSMAHSGASVGQQPGRPAAAYYGPVSGQREPLEVLSLLGAGGLASTAEDLCRFQDSFSGKGPQIFGRQALAEMRREQPTPFRGKLRHSQIAFGLGWDMTDLPTFRARGIQVMGKSGGTGRYTSMMFTAPGQRISVAVIETGAGGSALEISLEMLQAVLAARNLVPEDSPSVSKPPEPQPIPARYASYAGFYVPLRKISFDLGKNLVTVESRPVDQEPQSTTMFYSDGYFYDKEGNPFYFTTVDGEDYLLAYRPSLDVDMMLAQKVRAPIPPLSLQADMDGALWLVRNSRWFEGVQGTSRHVMTSRTFADLPGFVDFDGPKKVTAPDFAGMPVSNIRDLQELTLVQREGTTWAWLSESLFSPASAAPLLQAGEHTLTIGAEGFSQWVKTGAGLVLAFDMPADSRVLVFSPQGQPLYDSAVDEGEVYAAPGCFVEFAADPGKALGIRGR